jgi:hypothetical protein
MLNDLGAKGWEKAGGRPPLGVASAAFVPSSERSSTGDGGRDRIDRPGTGPIGSSSSSACGHALRNKPRPPIARAGDPGRGHPFPRAGRPVTTTPHPCSGSNGRAGTPGWKGTVKERQMYHMYRGLALKDRCLFLTARLTQRLVRLASKSIQI